MLQAFLQHLKHNILFHVGRKFKAGGAARNICCSKTFSNFMLVVDEKCCTWHPKLLRITFCLHREKMTSPCAGNKYCGGV